MNSFQSLIAHHGYLLVFGIVLAESLGLPLPASLALVGAGAAVAARILRAPIVLSLAFSGLLMGDLVLFFLGRYTGWALLGALCRLSINPETCILRSAESFYKRGKMTVMIAKFIPGLNTMSAPLAGSMKMRFGQFLRLDSVGALAYVLAYSALGYVFRDFLAKITQSFQTAGHILTETLIIAAVIYLAYRIWLYGKYKLLDVVPRVQVQELARKLQSEDSKVLLVDVRSHGYYDAGAERIKGSIRLEPNNLAEELKSWSTDKDIYLYCT
ncbi:MAG: VTT domain-containing protein [Acidobacteriaceae bacterium]|nr:VTT domain-containing protein [Acidobacteriaceae bacterium]